MDAELFLRFQDFEDESKKAITEAIECQCRHDHPGYKRAIQGLSRRELEWVTAYETGLIKMAMVA